jgi:hypothetical protein
MNVFFAGGLALLVSVPMVCTRAATMTVSDSAGAAAVVALPVSVPIPAAVLQTAGGGAGAQNFAVRDRAQGGLLRVQFEPEQGRPGWGRLWWTLPASPQKERTFELIPLAWGLQRAVSIKAGPGGGYYDFRELDQPVLRYNHGTVAVPAGVPTNYARGDYIMPLFGPNGEALADDYPKDHPHHRGLGWSWPVTRLGKEVRDIWAVVGVWARPLRILRQEEGSVFALLEAESVWKWGDTNPIVREVVSIRAFARTDKGRCVDIEVALTALADEVAIGGRPHGGYGGFGLRAMPAKERVITPFTDPPEAKVRRSWLDYSGVFAGGKGPSGLAIFEHPGNLYYPNTLLTYPDLHYVMPAFPGEREVPLTKDKPLVLKHRVWIHTGMGDAASLAASWSAYATPPSVRLLDE